MKVSTLNSRITFQKHIVTVDEIGNRINSWEDYYSCWAAVAASKLSVKETDDTAQTLEQQKLDFTVRYCEKTAAINSTEYRIIFEGRIYNISSINNMSFLKKSLKFTADLARR